MSKPSRRPNREAIKEKVKERKSLFKILRKQQENEGIETLPRSSMPNRKSPSRQKMRNEWHAIWLSQIA